ncbi:MAG: ThiF family adenylyltransferase, partial [Clostridia bacterium]|nr:ThiF family adenylyltransferase [Clostridia bacterium]
LSDEQMERYSRQILLPEIGPQGQARLLRSRAVIIGAGGLGSPAALYLAAAGVGTIGLVDGDRVELSNLHRQILHADHDVGRPKTRSARRRLEDQNPDVTVVEHPVRLTAENALSILAAYDVVVNGSDNFPTRYLVNDACVLLGKPLVDASILQWEGQLHVFLPGQGCYRCLYPQPPAPGTVPSCAEGGIVGAVAGVMGALQALETLKVLLGLDGVLADRTLLLDARTGRMRTFRRTRRPDCPVCGDEPTVRELIDYEVFCGLPSAGASAASGAGTAPGAAPQIPTDMPSDIPVETAARWFEDPAVAWFDVREAEEFERGHVPGARLLPLDDLPSRLAEIPQDRPSVFVCLNGQRSGLAVELLQGLGYGRTHNLAGGILAWENRGLPLETGRPARTGA